MKVIRIAGTHSDQDGYYLENVSALLIRGLDGVYSENWPRSGMTAEWHCHTDWSRVWRAAPKGPHLHTWPTPTARDYKDSGASGRH